MISHAPATPPVFHLRAPTLPELEAALLGYDAPDSYLFWSRALHPLVVLLVRACFVSSCTLHPHTPAQPPSSDDRLPLFIFLKPAPVISFSFLLHALQTSPPFFFLLYVVQGCPNWKKRYRKTMAATLPWYWGASFLGRPSRERQCWQRSARPTCFVRPLSFPVAYEGAILRFCPIRY